jgi:serine kinase of HPr protein (carbohydrate metabolism regulator)
MSETIPETIHASTVAIDGHAVLLEGPSGAGKSDLALRLIDRGAVLVSDDYTLLNRSDGLLLASAPATIAGQIEVRGVGILPLSHAGPISVAMIVRLARDVERLPEPVTRLIAGVSIPEIAIDPREHSAPIKVELALRHLLDGAS